MYSGQVCEWGTRLLVPESRKEEIVARLVHRVHPAGREESLRPDRPWHQERAACGASSR